MGRDRMKKEFWDEAEEKALTTLVNKASRNKGQRGGFTTLSRAGWLLRPTWPFGTLFEDHGRPFREP